MRVYDEAGNVIETHEHKGDFKEWCGSLRLPEPWLSLSGSPMRSRIQGHLLCAAVAFLAACQSPPANQGTQPRAITAQSGTPSRHEVDSLGPFQREPGVGLRGGSFFGRGP